MIDIWVNIDNSYSSTGHVGSQADPYSWSDFKTRFASTTPGDIELRFWLRGKRTLTSNETFSCPRNAASEDFIREINAWNTVTYGHPLVTGSSTLYFVGYADIFAPFEHGLIILEDLAFDINVIEITFNTIICNDCYFENDRLSIYGAIYYLIGCTFKINELDLQNHLNSYLWRYVYDCYFSQMTTINFGDFSVFVEAEIDNNIFENSQSDLPSDVIPYLTNNTFDYIPTVPLITADNLDNYNNRGSYSYKTFGIVDVTDLTIIARWNSLTYKYGGIPGGTITGTATTSYDKGLFDTDRKAQGAFWFSVLLTADFSATPLFGKANLSVQFQDLTTGSPTSWIWDFGDGNTSTLQNPSHIYTTAGTYTITLTASNGSSSDSETKINYITVSPDASFSATPLQGRVPLNVQFQDLTTGNPTFWDWDFGDGSTHSSVQNPSHIYTASGIYTVTLIASRGSNSDTEIKISYITVLPRLELTSYDSETGEAIEKTDELNFGILIGGQHSYRPVVLRVASPDTTSNLKLFLERKTENEEYAYYTNPTFIPLIKSGGLELQNHLVETPDASFSSPNGISIPLTDSTSDFIWLDVYIPSENRRIFPNFRFIFESL